MHASAQASVVQWILLRDAGAGVSPRLLLPLDLRVARDGARGKRFEAGVHVHACHASCKPSVGPSSSCTYASATERYTDSDVVNLLRHFYSYPAGSAVFTRPH